MFDPQFADAVTAGQWTSREDFKLEWPDTDETEVLIYYYPNTDRGLSDPRYRRLRYDPAVNEYDVSDHYPFKYHFIFLSVLLVCIGGLYLLIQWGLRGLQKTYEFDGMLAAKKVESENSAAEVIARMKARG